MKKLNIMFLSLMVVGCNSRTFPKTNSEDASRCWSSAKIKGDRIHIDAAKILYLRDSALIIPSETCDEIRMQGVSFSKESLAYLRKTDYNYTLGRLGFVGSLDATFQKRNSKKVIEINIAHIYFVRRLSQKSSEQLLLKIKR